MNTTRISAWALAATGLLLPAVAFAADAQFAPLTQIPAFQEVVSTNNISGFLNTMYKLCIGVAAVLAVLQIIRAGIMYMSPDSVAEKSEARNLISLSLFGLLLVLSPVIVFGIIDKRILEVGFDVSPLAGTATAPVETVDTPKSTIVPYVEKKFYATPGEYLIIAAGVMQGSPTCTTLAGDSYKTTDSCKAALASWKKSTGAWANWKILNNCVYTGINGDYVIKGNLCEAQDHIPPHPIEKVCPDPIAAGTAVPSKVETCCTGASLKAQTAADGSMTCIAP